MGRHSTNNGSRRRPAMSRGYRRILVPAADNSESESALDVACRLASEQQASIAVVAVIEVPRLPLDAHMVEEEADAREVVDRAVATGKSYGVSASPRIVHARRAGSAIVEQAAMLGAEIVVLGGARKSYARARVAMFGSTVQEVLRKAPCRVMLAATRDGPVESPSVAGASEFRPD